MLVYLIKCLYNFGPKSYHLDGGASEVVLGDVHILDLRGHTFLREEVQQGAVVGGRGRGGGPVCLRKQGLSSAVDLRGDEQLGDGRFEVLLVILVLIERLPQLHRHIFCGRIQSVVTLGGKKWTIIGCTGANSPAWFDYPDTPNIISIILNLKTLEDEQIRDNLALEKKKKTHPSVCLHGQNSP